MSEENLMTNFENVYNQAQRLDTVQESVFLPSAAAALNTIVISHPTVWKLYKKLRALDWDANEFDHSRSKIEMNESSQSDISKITKTLLWQWEADSTASRIITEFLGAFDCGTELSAIAQRIAENETLHSHSYSEIVKNCYDDIDQILDMLHNDIAPMKRLTSVATVFSQCIDTANKVRTKQIDKDSDEALASILMFFGTLICLERIQFIGSFNVTFTYGDRGSWNSIAKTIQKIATDELTIHVKTWMYCFQNEIALAKYSNVKPKVLERLETVCMEVLRSELAYCDVLFSDHTNITRQGKTDITIDLLKEAVRFEAQSVFDFFGFELPFARIERHPLPYTLQWKEINATQTSPQEELTGNYLLGGFLADLDEGTAYMPEL